MKVLIDLLQKELDDTKFKIKFKFQMLQRQYRSQNQYGFREKLEISQQQLLSDFHHLNNIKDNLKKNIVSQAQCSNILQEMIQRMSFPIIGIELLKDKFAEMNLFQNTGFKNFQAIQYKSQAIYVEVMIGDLKKMLNQQTVDTFSQQEVKNIVEQINWKIGMEKSIHESQVQEVGEHVDLMKFFEGVRNYQNWHQNIKKQTIQHLKHKAHDVQLKLTLKKGFLMSKIQKLQNTFETFNKQQFFNKCINISKIHKIQKICKKIQLNMTQTAFKIIFEKSLQIKDSERLRQLVQKYWPTKITSKVPKQLLQLARKQLKIKLFIKKVEAVQNKKKISQYAKFLQKINFKSKVKHCKLSDGVNKIISLIETKQKCLFIKKLGIPQFKFLTILNVVVRDTLVSAINGIKRQAELNRKTTPELSYRLKGKILSSLKVPDSKPIDMRNVFLNWYIKGNQIKFTKQVYNIWLTGTTSKFTFFMRLKNLIDQNRNYKIKYQLKLFLMVFLQKTNNYYNHGQKSIFQKWVQNTRRIKKIQNSFKTLQQIQNQTNAVLKKDYFDKIVNTYKKSLILQKFCFKYMNSYISNVKLSVDTWKILPDVKKSKGQITMRKVLRIITNQITSKKQQTFNIFKQNKTQGKDKKIRCLRKAFNQDIIYLQKYFQVWRMKKNDLIKQEDQFEDKKGKTILLLQKYQRNLYKKNIKDIIKKFTVKSLQNKNRDIRSKKIFVNILNKNEKKNMARVLNVFKGYWQEGKIKKNNLVRMLVEANKKKQTLALFTVRNKSLEMNNLQKIKRTQELFACADNVFKNSFQIFDKSTFIFGFLKKLLNNRANNLDQAFKFFKALPNRINWKKRDNGIKLYETLTYFYKRNKGFTLNKYKESLITGRFKMTKSMDIMAAKYFDVTRRYFNMYRKNVNRIKSDQINKSIGVSFQNMNEVLSNNYKMLYIGEAQWLKKSNHFIKLNLRVKDRLGQTFKLWRQTSKQIGYFNNILREKKTRYVEILMKAINKNEVFQAKKTISMFQKNAKINDIQLAFLKRLCDSQAGKVVKAMMIWKNLPQPKNKAQIARATRFQSTMAKICMRNFKKSFICFKDGQYFGNQRKKYCIRQLVAKSNSGIKSYFQKWKGNSKLSIIFSQCQKISHLIHISHNVTDLNLKLLFGGNEAAEKRQKLHKLDLILRTQKKQLISLWRQKATGLRNQDRHKALLLTKFASIHQSTQNKNVRDYAIKKFAEFRLLNLLQKQKMKEARLLAVIDNSQKRRKQNICQSFEVLRFNLYKGNFKKKKAFENWLRDKIQHINGIFAGWNNLTKQTIMSEKRMLIDTNFSSMEEIVKTNFVHLISNRKQLELKKKMLDNIFRAQQSNLKGYLNLWKNNAKQLKILSQLDQQSKKTIIQRINKIAQSGSDHNIKKAIMKFHQSMKVQAVQKKFINQLLKTKSGLVLEAFGKWKTIPVINLGERYKKAQKFFYKLENMYKGHLGFVHQTFKKQSDQGNLVKKQSILQLFDMTSTGIRRFYRRWQKFTKQRHTLQGVSSLMRSMDIMNQALTSQYLLIFQDQRAYTIKVNAINKLIAAAQGTTQNYFNKWRSIAKQLKIDQSMDQQKKTLALAMFTRAIEGSEKTQVIDTIRKFKLNSIVTQISKKFFNRLLQTKTGKLVQFMQKMKSIPDAKLAVRKKKAIKFQGALNRFAMKILRGSFNPFKTCNYIAIDRKKYCINKLVRISMGQEQKTFLRWRNVTREDKILSHSHLTDKTFSNMENLLSNGLGYLFKDHKEEIQKKKNLCRKLIMNSQFVQHHAFMIWKETYRTDETKVFKKQTKIKDILKNFINIHSDHEKKGAVGGFGQFRNLLMLKKLQQLSQMQNKTHNKAFDFVKVLDNLRKNRYGVFVQSCKNSAVQMNFANKLSSLQSFFKNTTDVYGQNLMMLMRNQRQSIIIQNALNRIFSNFKVGTQKAFNIWRQNARAIKFQQLMGLQKKKSIVDILTNLVEGGETSQLKKAINLFQTNFKQLKIQKQILMKILNCKSGKVPIMFMKWKALPSQTGKKYKLKAMKFQNSLYRAVNMRMKFVYQSFKTQSYDATVKKQFAIKKLIAVTQSDTNRVFNKWRKVNSQAKITSKLLTMDRTFSFSEEIFMKNIFIFSEIKKEHSIKVDALKKIFMVQQVHLKDSLNRWIEQNNRYKFDKIAQTLKKYTQPEMNKTFIKETFTLLKQRYQMENMKGYINSLWRWKMSNTEAHYYSKFIKVFRQSEQLLNLSRILNKKENDSLYYAFSQIQLRATIRHDKKCHLIEKYLLKKVRTYFTLFRKNAYKEQIQTWKSKYTVNIKVQQFIDTLSKIVRKQQNESFSILNKNEIYFNKVQKLIQILQNYSENNLKHSFKNIHKQGYFKIINHAFQIKNKVKSYFLSQSFNQIVNFSKIKHLNSVIQSVNLSAGTRKAYYRLRKNSQRLVRQKLSILLLSQKLTKVSNANTIKTLFAFRRRHLKAVSLQKLYSILSTKLADRKRMFFKIDQNDVKMVNLIQKFKKGTAIKNILQKQDNKILKTYFNRMKKKQNIWIGQSIRRFATRSSLRSSLAISLWRLKSYADR